MQGIMVLPSGNGGGTYGTSGNDGGSTTLCAGSEWANIVEGLETTL